MGLYKNNTNWIPPPKNNTSFQQQTIDFCWGQFLSLNIGTKIGSVVHIFKGMELCPSVS